MHLLHNRHVVICTSICATRIMVTSLARISLFQGKSQSHVLLDSWCLYSICQEERKKRRKKGSHLQDTAELKPFCVQMDFLGQLFTDTPERHMALLSELMTAHYVHNACIQNHLTSSQVLVSFWNFNLWKVRSMPSLGDIFHLGCTWWHHQLCYLW